MWFAIKHFVYRIFHGWNTLYPPLDPAAVRAGQIPEVWREWLSALERDIGGKMRKVYGDTFEVLVQHVVIVDQLPSGARGEAAFDGVATTLTLSTRSMNDRVYVQHEFLHCMQYRHNELYGEQSVPHQYPGDHWPFLFDPYGSH
jgi:hypothetical protein